MDNEYLARYPSKNLAEAAGTLKIRYQVVKSRIKIHEFQNSNFEHAAIRKNGNPRTRCPRDITESPVYHRAVK